MAVYWFPGPYGTAHESKEKSGVYFETPTGELLGVQFDDVEAEKDAQSLTTKKGTTVRIEVKKGKISIRVEPRKKKAA